MVAFALALVVGLRSSIRSPVALALAPIVVVGWYYVTVIPLNQTLVEALIGLPLFVVMWATTRMTESSDRWLRWALAAGVSHGSGRGLQVDCRGGGALVLGHCGVAAHEESGWDAEAGSRRSGGSRRLMAVLLPFIAYYASHGILDLVYRTTFVYPARITRTPTMHTAGSDVPPACHDRAELRMARLVRSRRSHPACPSKVDRCLDGQLARLARRRQRGGAQPEVELVPEPASRRPPRVACGPRSRRSHR